MKIIPKEMHLEYSLLALANANVTEDILYSRMNSLGYSDIEIKIKLNQLLDLNEIDTWKKVYFLTDLGKIIWKKMK